MARLNFEKAFGLDRVRVEDGDGFYSELLSGDGLNPVPIDPIPPSPREVREESERVSAIERIEALCPDARTGLDQGRRPPPGPALTDSAVLAALGRGPGDPADAVMVTVKEASAILGLRTNIIHNWIWKNPGRYPHVKVKSRQAHGPNRGKLKFTVATMKMMFEDSIRENRGMRIA